MFTRMLVYVSVCFAGCLGVCLGQQQPAAGAGRPSTSSSAMPVITQTFPLLMRQNVVAGKAPVGAKIEAKLLVATLVNGTVIPSNAVFSGEIVESQAKTSSAPSRLSIRLDLARWKTGSVAIRAYLTQWFYPLTLNSGPDLHGPEQSAKRTWNGMGQYPDPTSPAYKPFPAGADSERGQSSDTPSSVTSSRPVTMKDVESQSNSSGGITLVSNRSNLKLDKSTTYVFSSSDPVSGRAKE
jgi:hypothetical protein